MRARLRRLVFGLATLLGLKKLGFFIPYRYAAGVQPRRYPALEPLFRSAEPGMRDLIEAAEGHTGAFGAIAHGDGPARFDQSWFPRLDAVATYTLIRQTKPRRVVEIGSGHSTRFIARAVADGGFPCMVRAIDPAPRARLDALCVQHEPCLLQDADPALFAQIEPGDVLFIDSSHLAVPGSDVDALLGDVLPRLPAGVLVHLHDIFLPDPYPADWAWRGYNESLVAAALMIGGAFELLWSSHWVATRCANQVADSAVGRLPLLPGARETSLWLRTRRAGSGEPYRDAAR